ncbi:hypothetical protein ILYODFUR_021185 [Ilyodon furcidens]|uniref:Uncharacterized protein n=1 Tax=Ilyodon furcidens TaxID=33524 RepID=A0ABV0TWV3_9TELE
MQLLGLAVTNLLVLVQHCLSGWSNAGQNILPPPSNLDLRSSIRTKNSDGSLSQELQVRLRKPCNVLHLHEKYQIISLRNVETNVSHINQSCPSWHLSRIGEINLLL